jgi:hypothetical protein
MHNWSAISWRTTGRTIRFVVTTYGYPAAPRVYSPRPGSPWLESVSRVVFGEPFFRGLFIGEHHDVVDVANLGACVDVNQIV